MVRRGQPYRSAAQRKGDRARRSGKTYRGGYTRKELKAKKDNDSK